MNFMKVRSIALGVAAITLSSSVSHALATEICYGYQVKSKSEIKAEFQHYSPILWVETFFEPTREQHERSERVLKEILKIDQPDRPLGLTPWGSLNPSKEAFQDCPTLRGVGGDVYNLASTVRTSSGPICSYKSAISNYFFTCVKN